MKNSISFTPIVISLVLTPICLLIAAISGGVGHGSYAPAIILFPYAALSTELDRFFDATIIIMMLAIIQMPVYGLVLGFAAKRWKIVGVAVCLAVLHMLAALIALSI